MELEQVGRVVSDKEIARTEFNQTLEKIENKEFLDKCLKGEEWQVWKKVWLNTRDWAQHKLNGINPDDRNEIIRLQMMIDFYDNVLPRSVDNYRQLGREAMEIAKEQGWMDRILEVFQKH